MKLKTIKKLTKKEIIDSLESFEKGRGHKERYASFDYCFNYFQDFKHKEDKKGITDNMQYSCLHLGFYLASWGMYRGSTFILQKSVKVFEDLMKYIASPECDVWDIDINNYSKENIDKLITCAGRIERALKIHKPTRKNWDTLVTKIMLGVFGNIPAFDQYFKNASGLIAFNNEKAMRNALEQIVSFYDANKDVISQKAEKIKTYAFEDGETERTYTRAKIIDMIFFQKGLDESNIIKVSDGLTQKANKDNSVVYNASRV